MSDYSLHLGILITIICASLAIILGSLIYWLYSRFVLKASQIPQKAEQFRLEIRQDGKDYVRAGISLPADMDGATMGAVLQTGIIMLVRQDPLAVRILLLQILHVLGNEEDMKELLNSKESIRSS